MLNPDICSKLTIALLIVVLGLIIAILVKQSKTETYKHVSGTCSDLNKLPQAKKINATFKDSGRGCIGPAGVNYAAPGGSKCKDCVLEDPSKYPSGLCNENKFDSKCL